MSDPETISVYDKRAAEYADKFHSLKQDRHLTAFIELLEPKCRVLDFGCGPGYAAARLVEMGFTAEAWDASAGMIEIAARNPYVLTKQARFEELDARNIYGGIWANFSLLHAPRVAFPSHIKAISTALRSGGIFHIGMKIGRDHDRDNLGRAYTYYETDEIEGELAKAGLEVLSKTTGRDAGLAGTVDPWVVMLSRKADA